LITPSPASLALLSTSVGAACSAVGVSTLIGKPRRIVPFSGGLLMGIALFGVVPELAEQYTWSSAAGMLVVGLLLLWAFGHYVYPICPSCSHTHDHDHCVKLLHGFALPLIAAASIHSLLDGLGIAASKQEPGTLGATVLLGVMLHKIPEGLALGVMFRAAVDSRASALFWCTMIESMTFFGALLENAAGEHLGTAWIGYALALAGASFLYLGFHAVHGEWRRRGTPAFMPALTGAAGAAALQHGLRIFLR